MDRWISQLVGGWRMWVVHGLQDEALQECEELAACGARTCVAMASGVKMQLLRKHMQQETWRMLRAVVWAWQHNMHAAYRAASEKHTQMQVMNQMAQLVQQQAYGSMSWAMIKWGHANGV